MHLQITLFIWCFTSNEQLLPQLLKGYVDLTDHTFLWCLLKMREQFFIQAMANINCVMVDCLM